MKNNKLQISLIEQKDQTSTTSHVTRAARRQEIQATLDRLWKIDPNQFDPNRNFVERKRIEQTIETIRSKTQLLDKRVVDIGCGGGKLSCLVRNLGAIVDAVDASNLALLKLKTNPMENINPMQDSLPSTFLKNSFYDIVICTEVIGYLKPQEYRIAFSELARLLKQEGHIVFSTSLDINSSDSLEKLTRLAETEFEIDTWVINYHLLWLRIRNFFESPKLFADASSDLSLRNFELAKRKGFTKKWFKLNTHFLSGACWNLVSFALKPLNYFIQNNASLINILEKISVFFWSETGMTHALFIGHLRKMSFPLPKNRQPIELKHKREVWE